LLWLGLTASFVVMGVGIASFQSSLGISGTIATSEASAQFVNNPRITDKHLTARVYEDDEDKNDSGAMGHDETVITQDTSGDDEESNKPSLSAVLERDKKAIDITIEDAYPGDVYKLHYQVENTGSIPIELSLRDESEEKNISIEDNNLEDNNLNPQEMTTGELEITLSGSKEDLTSGTEEYGISVELSYEQWNAK